MTMAGAIGSSALSKELWGCVVHLKSLLCFGIIVVVLSNVLLFLPFLGKMPWIHLSSSCLQCLRNFELRAEQLALADMTAILLGA